MTGRLKNIRDSIRSWLRFRREHLDAVVWMQECPFTDAIISQLAAARPNSLVVVASLFRGQFYAYQPPGLTLRQRPLLSILNMKWLSPRMAYLIYPVFMMLSYPILFAFYLWLGLRFRVNSVLIFDHQQTAVAGVLRRLGLFRRLVFFAGDWYPGSGFRKGIWTRLGNEVYFPALDWMACRLSDLTINQTTFVAEGRKKYWGRQIAREEVGFRPPLIVKSKGVSHGSQRRKIVFLGATRPDSGLDLVLRALPRVREQLGEISLKIVGPASATVEELRKIAGESGLEACFEFAGVADYAAFESVFADCYCGVNLITDPNSYSVRAIPAKILDYFQHLLPPLVTDHVGPMADTMREGKLGLVVEPEVNAVASGLIELYRNRSSFVQNIETFIKGRDSTDFVQLLCPEVTHSKDRCRQP